MMNIPLETLGELILRLLVAGIFGGVIGIDRTYREKEAGLRTHFLVAVGSALFMIISQYGFGDVHGLNDGRYDGSRVAAQIVSGIGFIGAGSIIFHKRIIRGLTTAAGLWTASGIGMAVGGGLYIIAAAATLLTLIGLEALRFALTKSGIDYRSAKVAFTVRNQEELKEAIHRIKALGCKVSRCSTSAHKGAWLRVVMDIRFHEKVENDGRLLAELASHPDLRVVKND